MVSVSFVFVRVLVALLVGVRCIDPFPDLFGGVVLQLVGLVASHRWLGS